MNFPDQQHKRKRVKRQRWIMSGVCLLFLAPTSLPYLYTPPALTSKKLAAYRKTLKFLDEHRDSKGRLPETNVTISWYSEILGFGRKSAPTVQNSVQHLHQISILHDQVSQAGCRMIWSDSNMILFWPERSYFTPMPPIVLYTFDGRDPNLYGNTKVTRLRPYRQIRENWYMSRKLVTDRTANIFDLPKGLIDRSLQWPS